MEEENARIHNIFNREAGQLINMNSTLQLRQLFFHKLKRKPVAWTAGGAGGNKQPSLNEAVLKKWAEKGDKLAKYLLQYRKNTKMLSTYIKGLMKFMDNDFRIHTTLNMHVTATGRLSSRDPNLQNIPARDWVGHEIRDSFIAGPGKSLICVDYSTLEMRIMAHMSEDKNMIKLIKEGRDIHSGTASLMFGVLYEDMVKAKKAEGEGKATEHQMKLLRLRNYSKTIGFGLIYGMGAPKLSYQLGCSIKEAESYMNSFFAPFPNVRLYISRQHALVEKAKEVYTLLGRPRRLFGTLSGGSQRGETYRQSTNTPIQGGAADIVMKAMLKCAKNKKLKALGTKMLLQIHDELIFETDSENAEESAKIIKECMENPGIELKVPLKVDPGIGMTWAEAKR
jgi:DNA polymerase-1